MKEERERAEREAIERDIAAAAAEAGQSPLETLSDCSKIYVIQADSGELLGCLDAASPGSSRDGGGKAVARSASSCVRAPGASRLPSSSAHAHAESRCELRTWLPSCTPAPHAESRAPHVQTCARAWLPPGEGSDSDPPRTARGRQQSSQRLPGRAVPARGAAADGRHRTPAVSESHRRRLTPRSSATSLADESKEAICRSWCWRTDDARTERARALARAPGATPAQYLREIAVSCRQYCANPAYSADYPRYYPVP